MAARFASLALAALAALCGASPALAAPVRATDGAATLILRGARVQVQITKSPWRLTLADGSGRPLVSEADRSLPDPVRNAYYPLYHDTDGGIDLAYPGLPEVSYRPLAYRRDGTWQSVASLTGWKLSGARAELAVVGTDGERGVVTLDFDQPGGVRLHFQAPPRTDAVAESWAAAPGQRYVGGGQRFEGIDQTGRSVPLWVSHGVGSDRGYSTNEIAIPFLMSTGGWGFWSRSYARGEINVAVPGERPDALNLVHEDDALDLQLFTGQPAAILRSYTRAAGAPIPPPRWALRPMYWQDDDITEATVLAQVRRMRSAGIPVGAYWIDNPWETQRGAFTPRAELGDYDRLLQALHGMGVEVVSWASPFFSAATTPADYKANGNGVGGNDATYMPPRGLEPHLDLTNPAATEHLIERAAALIERGVDGFKLDRGEEDLGDDAKWFNGAPNRLNHNEYVLRYDRAMRTACIRAGKPDCFIVARGGVAGTSRYAANWAADNLTGPGPLGLGQALNSLLSLSLSGQPTSGSDIGGYVGTRSEASAPIGTPTVGTYARWTELGAFSPIMESANDPTAFTDPTGCTDLSKLTTEPGCNVVAIARRYATIHDRLGDYSARWLAHAAKTGMPLVRPLLLAYPDDAAAVRTDDEYLFGPDLLVAPIVNPLSDSGPDARTVYLPAGGWTDAWSGMHWSGPVAVPVVAPLDQIPLFIRDGGSLSRDLLKGV